MDLKTTDLPRNRPDITLCVRKGARVCGFHNKIHGTIWVYQFDVKLSNIANMIIKLRGTGHRRLS